LLEKFVDSDSITPVVATTVDLLSTGIDAPSVKNIVLLSPIRSKVLFKQIVGRGSRIDETTKKYEFRIIDYVNATRLFDEWDYPALEENLARFEPKNKFLAGRVLDSELGFPIQASLTVQLDRNEQLFVRTDSNGSFAVSNLPPMIKLRIHANNYKDKTIVVEAFENLAQNIIIELEKRQEREERILVDNLPIYISEETKLEIADGRRLNTAQYIEYSKDEIRKIVSLEDLRRVWSSSEKRKRFLEELRERSISPKIISDMIAKPDVDTFDVIAHIAFDAPLITRDERSKAFSLMKSDFINSLGSGKDIILALLEKYRISGIENISNTKIYNTPPFDEMGYVKGVISKVGGLDNLKKIIEQLEKGLY
jgi:type I restriction enzyme R subunit